MSTTKDNPSSASSSSSAEEAFIAVAGKHTYADNWSSVSRLSPEMFAASKRMHSVPSTKKHLDPITQSLIGLAVDCAATHLYPPGIRAQIATALDRGASTAQIVETMELSMTLGIHACNIGVPLLFEVLKEEGLHDAWIAAGEGRGDKLDPEREELKADFTAKRGYWHPFWEEFLRLDPEFFGAYLELSTVPWTKKVGENERSEGVREGQGALTPKVKELVYCAFDAASTHLYVPGLKLHYRNALRYGASPEEIMEVLEIATLLSLHTASVSFPILEEELKARGTSS